MKRAPAAILMLAVLAVLASCAPRPAPLRVTRNGETLQVALEYRGDALALSLVGDFNGWDPTAHSFHEISPRLWRCDLDLAPGRYAYLFRLERREGIILLTDPLNPLHMRDGAGVELSVMDLSASIVDNGPRNRQRP